MKNLGSTFFIVLLITLGYLIFGTWYWTCQVKGLCDNEVASIATPATDPEPTPPAISENTTSYFSQPFQLMDNGTAVVDARTGIRFGKNSATPVFGSGVAKKFSDLVDYIQGNELKDLVITGFYSPEDQMPEGMSSTNLGQARAMAFRQLLIDRGVPANRMISIYERSTAPNLYDDADSLRGGIKLEVKTRNADPNTIENPLIEPSFVRFETGSSYIKLDAELRSKITQTIQYLNTHPDKKLSLTGHTDDQGQAENNRKLGLDRAKDLAKTFAEFGLMSDQITTASEGEDAPMASNDTPEGRAQNRRVEMRIPN